jgi:hypothetical protein
MQVADARTEQGSELEPKLCRLVEATAALIPPD